MGRSMPVADDSPIEDPFELREMRDVCEVSAEATYAKYPEFGEEALANQRARVLLDLSRELGMEIGKSDHYLIEQEGYYEKTVRMSVFLAGASRKLPINPEARADKLVDDLVKSRNLFKDTVPRAFTQAVKRILGNEIRRLQTLDPSTPQ